MQSRRRLATMVVAFVMVAAWIVPRASAATPDATATRRELATSAGALDAFWTTEFASRGLEYVSPSLVMETGPFHSACAGETWFAAYCPIDLALHVDPAASAASTGRYGPGIVDLTVAHEWTHHIITILIDVETMQETVRPIAADVRIEEHVADCQSGAFVAGRWEGASDEDARVDAARAFLSDNESTIHGNRDARVDAFERGYRDGLAACGLMTAAPTNRGDR